MPTKGEKSIKSIFLPSAAFHYPPNVSGAGDEKKVNKSSPALSCTTHSAASFYQPAPDAIKFPSAFVVDVSLMQGKSTAGGLRFQL